MIQYNSVTINNKEEDLESQIRKQVEYYFSEENLIKDVYLRNNMILEGWVLLTTVASFPIISALTKDISNIIKALKNSMIVEISSDYVYIRPKLNPTKWIINEYKIPGYIQFEDLKSNVKEKESNNDNNLLVKKQRTISDLPPLLENQITENNLGQMTNLCINNNNSMLQNHRNRIFSSVSEEDVQDYEMQSLLLVTSNNASNPDNLNNWRNINATNKSMSNNKERNFRSISMSEPAHTWYTKITETISTPERVDAYKKRNNYSRSKSISVNFDNQKEILPLRKSWNNGTICGHTQNIKWSYENSQSNEDTEGARQNQIGFIFHKTGGKMDFQNCTDNFPPGYIFQDYQSFKNNCLFDRDCKGSQPSQKMNMIYRFWSFFIRENFNRNLFIEFRNYSKEDFQMNKRYGIECLFRFYSYGLEKKFRKDIFNFFQVDTLDEYNKGYRYGLEKFWAFLHYSQRKVDINTNLNNILKTYKTLQDFRINFTPPEGFFVIASEIKK